METVIFCAIFLIALIRAIIISDFKINYYETKLKNRDVNISHIQNIGIIGILKSGAGKE